MKNILCVFVMLVLLTGCGFKSVKISEAVKKVGLIVNSNSNTLCHNYKGITVFQNKVNKYEFSNSFSEAIKDNTLKVLSSIDVDYVVIDAKEISADGTILNRSSWDNSQAVKDELKSVFLNKMQEANVDAVLVYENLIIESDEACQGIAYVDGGTYGVYMRGGATALLDRNGNFSENIYLHIKLSGSPIARQPRQLDRNFIDNAEMSILSKYSDDLATHIGGLR